MQIARNAAKCLKCGDEIASHHRHDFVYCKCRAIAVDGGTDYLKRVGNREDWEEASAYSTGPLIKDNPGQYVGMYLIWSEGGRVNPSTVFHRRSDAVALARVMRQKFSGNWYIAQIEAVE